MGYSRAGAVWLDAPCWGMLERAQREEAGSWGGVMRGGGSADQGPRKAVVGARALTRVCVDLCRVLLVLVPAARTETREDVSTHTVMRM